MTEHKETVVRVDNLKEYRAVLEKWFSKGYNWARKDGEHNLNESYFTYGGARYLILEERVINYSNGTYLENNKLEVTSFKEFMDKENGKVTYEVSEDQTVFIKEVKDSPYPAAYLMGHNYVYEALFSAGDYDPEFERDLLRYLGGDANVVFQEKDPLYLLKGKDSDGDTVYFTLDGVGAPTYVYDDEKSDAFKAPREEIVRWYNPFWKVEKVNEDD